MLRRTPLAWHNLTHDKRRLVLSAGGVGFAVLLMFLEVGFLFTLLDSTVEVLKRLHGDLIIISRTNFSMVALERFDIRRIYQARSVPGVAGAYPLYMETLGAVLRRGDRTPPNKGFPIRGLPARPRGL